MPWARFFKGLFHVFPGGICPTKLYCMNAICCSYGDAKAVNLHSILSPAGSRPIAEQIVREGGKKETRQKKKERKDFQE